jgi:hypothetical protein
MWGQKGGLEPVAKDLISGFGKKGGGLLMLILLPGFAEIKKVLFPRLVCVEEVRSWTDVEITAFIFFKSTEHF